MKNLMLLAKYNREANAKMNAVIGTLADGEWDRRFGGFYASIHELCSHVFNSDRVWLARVKAAGDFTALRDGLFSEPVDMRKPPFDDVGEYVQKRADLDAKIVALTAEMTAADAAKKIAFVNYKGEQFERSAGVLLLHLFNHDTHHRAMASLYLEMLGKENDFSGLYIYE
jgi:uncharacterized damage-inducible protein DinB